MNTWRTLFSRLSSPVFRSRPVVLIFGLMMVNSIILSAQPAKPLPDKPEGFVTDEVGLFTPSQRQSLENQLSAFQDSTSNVIAIAILQNLRELPREEVATQLFNSWRMWEDDRYNGVLILVALDDRQMQIEVGYGLEGAIPDALAGRIVQDVLRPAFRNEAYFEGLSEAVSILITASKGEYSPISDDETTALDIVVTLLILGLIFGIITLLKARDQARQTLTIGSSDISGMGRYRHGNHSYWTGSFGRGSSSGSGSFGGFSGSGGFGSGGAGAGGGW